MELNEIPEAFQTNLRIAIISSLMTGIKTFKEIKVITGASDGNISIQVGKLEEMGYMASKKEFIGKKPCTSYQLSELGHKMFLEYVDMLERLIKRDEKI